MQGIGVLRRALVWYRDLSVRYQVVLGVVVGVVFATVVFGLITAYALRNGWPLSRLLSIVPLFGLGVLAVASASAWLHARYILRPLGELEKAAARIARGLLDEPPITTARKDEIGRLAQSFNAMCSQLKAASEARAWWERELEKRVRERTMEVQRLVKQVIHAQEEERRRLAQELHDDTAPALANLLMGMEAIRDSLLPGQERLRQHIERSILQGSRSLEELRRIILGLRPAALDYLGLVSGLHSYARARLAPLGVSLDFEVQGEARRLPEAVEVGLFRMLQEAINNIARHAAAQHARVQLHFQNDRLTAIVEDDGRGFDLQEVQRMKRGLGLEGMQERAEIIGAHLELVSAPGKGTKVKVELPLLEEAVNGQSPSAVGR